MDSKGGGWLSTRNKFKIQPKQKLLRRRLSLPQQHKPLNEFVLTQSPPPEELFKNTKQSHLTSFFKPHLISIKSNKGTLKQHFHQTVTLNDGLNTNDTSKQHLQNTVNVNDDLQLAVVETAVAAITGDKFGDTSNGQRSNVSDEFAVGSNGGENDQEVNTNQVSQTQLSQTENNIEQSVDGFQTRKSDSCIAKSFSRRKRKLGEYDELEADLENGTLSDEENIDCLPVQHLMEDSIQRLKSFPSEGPKRMKKRLKAENENECGHNDDKTQTRTGYLLEHCVNGDKDKETTNVLENSLESSGHTEIREKCNVNDEEQVNVEKEQDIGPCSLNLYSSYLENTSQLNDQSQNLDTECNTNFTVPSVLSTSTRSNNKLAKCDSIDIGSIEEQEQLSLSLPDESQLSLYVTESNQLSFDNSLQLESQFTFRSQREYYDALEKGVSADELYTDSANLATVENTLFLPV